MTENVSKFGDGDDTHYGTRLVECQCGHLHAGQCGGVDEVGRTCGCAEPRVRNGEWESRATTMERDEDERGHEPWLNRGGSETADAPPPHGFRTEDGA